MSDIYSYIIFWAETVNSKSPVQVSETNNYLGADISHSAITAIPTPTTVPTTTPTATHTPTERHFYVDDDFYPGIEDGTSEHPFNTIQKALEVADEDDVIHVAAGNYYERLIINKDNITLLGGYQASSPNEESCYYEDNVSWYRDPVSYPSIIDGGSTGICVAFYNVDYAIIDGFHITHGINGILCNESVPDILNNQIFQNGDPSDPNNYGAGIRLIGSSPVIKNNLIFNNNAGAEGGGIMIFSGSSPEILFNTIAHNSSVGNGSGIMIERDSCPIFSHNIIVSNNNNCGIYVQEVSCELTIEYNDVWDNGDDEYCGDIDDQTGDNGNISTDPLFYSGPCGNYYLENEDAGQSDTSPCVDEGGTSSEAVEQQIYMTRIDGVSDLDEVDIGYHCFDTVPPTIPVPFYVFPGDERITLRWLEAQQEDLIGYNIYRNSNSGEPLECAHLEMCGGSFQDEDRVNGVRYFYRVTSVDLALNESITTYEDNTRCTDKAPESPGVLSCESGNGYVKLSWPEVEGRVWYNLYRGNESGCYSLLETQITKTEYEDSDVENDLIYYYVVSAYESHKYESQWSSECIGRPMKYTATPTTTPSSSPTSSGEPTSTPTASATPTPSGIPDAPKMIPEPPFSCGSSNTVHWTDESPSGAVNYQAQASDTSDFRFSL